MVDFYSELLSRGFVKVIAAIVILLIGLVIGRFLGKLVHRVLKELELNKILKNSGIGIPMEELIGRLVKYIIYFIALIMALNQIGLTTAVLNIILIVILVLIIIFIVLAVKDFIPNLVAGVVIHQKRDLKEGDKIKVRGIEGTIEHINLIETKVKTKTEVMWVPNSLLTKEIVVRKEIKKKN
jgi:small-conductance mechanosensitive channel